MRVCIPMCFRDCSRNVRAKPAEVTAPYSKFEDYTDTLSDEN